MDELNRTPVYQKFLSLNVEDVIYSKTLWSILKTIRTLNTMIKLYENHPPSLSMKVRDIIFALDLYFSGQSLPDSEKNTLDFLKRPRVMQYDDISEGCSTSANSVFHT